MNERERKAAEAFAERFEYEEEDREIVATELADGRVALFNLSDPVAFSIFRVLSDGLWVATFRDRSFELTESEDRISDLGPRDFSEDPLDDDFDDMMLLAERLGLPWGAYSGEEIARYDG